MCVCCCVGMNATQGGRSRKGDVEVVVAVVAVVMGEGEVAAAEAWAAEEEGGECARAHIS